MRDRQPSFLLYTAPVALWAGLAMGLSPAPREWSSLAFLGPPLILLAIESTGATRDRPRIGRSLAVGFLAGTVCNAFALFWVFGLLQRFGHFPLAAAIPVGLLLFVGQAAQFAVATLFTAALVRRGAPGWLTLPVCFAAAYSVTPALFPWRPSVSQLPWIEWVQLAEVGGEPLLDFLWAMVGCGLLEAARARHRPALALGLSCLLLPFAYGALRLPQVRAERERAPLVRVGVVQPNIGIEEKHDMGLSYGHLDLLRRMTRDLEARGADVVMWPETSYPFPFPRSRRMDFPGALAMLGDGVRGPLLVGAVTMRSQCESYNSALAVEADGRVTGISDKVELLAFGEYVPLWEVLPPLQQMFPCRGLVPGDAPRVLPLAGARFGVLNCYEDVLSRYGWRLMHHGPDVLVNITNDAWFGDTAEPHLHHYVARMRAIETRRDLVRVVNTGVSAHVLATGEDPIETATWVQAAFVAPVRRLHGTTPWVRLGDVFTWLFVGWVLGALLTVRRRRASDVVGAAPWT